MDTIKNFLNSRSIPHHAAVEWRTTEEDKLISHGEQIIPFLNDFLEYIGTGIDWNYGEDLKLKGAEIKGERIEFDPPAQVDKNKTYLLVKMEGFIEAINRLKDEG